MSWTNRFVVTCMWHQRTEFMAIGDIGCSDNRGTNTELSALYCFLGCCQ